MHAFLLPALFASSVVLGPPAAPRPGTKNPADGAVDLVWMVGPVEVTPPGPRPPATPRLRALGAKLYKAKCASCHGDRGDGRGPEASKLSIAPRDFTKAVYKVRSTPSGSLPTPLDLYVTMTRGMHGTPMMPWPRLTEEERWALVGRLESFSPRFREEKPGPVVTAPEPPPETAELRKRGEALYALHRCGACHGQAGAGDGPARAMYANEPRERAVRVRDFTRGRFIRGSEVTDIYLTLRTGLDGTPMGAYDALSPADLWALAAYSRSLVAERPLPQTPSPGERPLTAPGP